MMPDDICREYAERDFQLKVTEIDNTIVIQGTADALLFLSKLIAAQAESPDDGFQLSPFGAGCAWFAPGSTKGLYIQRIGLDADGR